jgi:hypothetical protein
MHLGALGAPANAGAPSWFLRWRGGAPAAGAKG